MPENARRLNRSETARFLRDHYRSLTYQTKSAIWVPMLDAIDAYEREPQLKAQLEEAVRMVATLRGQMALVSHPKYSFSNVVTSIRTHFGSLLVALRCNKIFSLSATIPITAAIREDLERNDSPTGMAQ